MQVGDLINRIGDETVDGMVLRVTVDMGGQPGTILAVQVGDDVRLVCAEACGCADVQTKLQAAALECHTELETFGRQTFPVLDLDAIGRDGATLPCADGADLTPGMN